MITLHILGAGGATPSPSHGPSAYWLEIDGRGLLLEAGSGALVRLVRQPGAPDRVDDINMVLLSHLHLDHAADLAPMLFAMHSVLADNSEPCLVAGPRGLARYLARLKDLYGNWIEPRNRKLVVREMTSGDRLELPGGGKAETFIVEHADHPLSDFCLGWSFTDAEGCRLVYSGDTGPSYALESAAAGCDLLLVECSTPDDLSADGHMSPGRVTDLVGKARPARVVLTHLCPLVAAQQPDIMVREATGIPCTAAKDGDTIGLWREDRFQ